MLIGILGIICAKYIALGIRFNFHRLCSLTQKCRPLFQDTSVMSSLLCRKLILI
jgi:hypothetical protein